MLLNPFRFGVTNPSIGYAAVIFADGPIIYWRLDETSGTNATDSSSNGNSGIYYTDVSTLTTAGLLNSDSNTAIFLAGTSNSASGIYKSSCPISITSAWAFECIINPSGSPSFDSVGCILQVGDPQVGSNIPELDIIDNGSGTYKIRLQNAGISQLGITTNVFNYGYKHHIVLRSDGTINELLIDGVSQFTVSHVYATPAINSLYVGYTYFSTGSNYYPFKGTLDEIAIYDSRLSNSQIAAHIAAI